MSVLYDALRKVQGTVLPGEVGGKHRRPTFETRQLPTLVGSPPPPSSDDSQFDVLEIMGILLRRRLWIYGCTATMLLAAALVCIFMTPQYRAVSELQLLKQDLGELSVGDMNPAGGGFADPLDFSLTLQTQVRVLKSDALALQVIKELNLADAEAFRLDRQATILERFKANLKVDGISGTRLITVSYTHPDPKMAARIVNQLVSDFVEYNFQVRYSATSKAAEFLGQQLVDLKSQVEKAQERAVQLQKDSGIFGEDERHNIVVTRLEQLNNEVTAAEEERVMKEAVYKLARSGNPELVAGMLGGRTDPTASGTANSLALLTGLRQQEANLDAEYADAATKYGPAYPRLIQIKERLTSVRSSIAAELGKVVDRAKREYELSASREGAARGSFAEQKKIAAQMNNKAIDFLIAKHEADSSRVLYEHLLGKVKEADVLAGLRPSELHVVDQAAIPDHPARPNAPLYLAFGALAGMVLGVVCAFVAHTMDHTIRDVGEIEISGYAPVLGVIPHAGQLPGNGSKHWLNTQMRNARTDAAHHASLPGLHNPAVAEAFRAVRTSLLLSQPDEPPKVLMITSGMAQEGKSFASLNLAAALAHNGSKVLLVDADLRRGTLSRVLNQHCVIGMSQVLLGDADLEDACRQLEDVPGITFIPAGAHPAQPSELLGSRRMAAIIESWRQQFDYVLIDTPPVLPVTDAVVLSPKVDTVIVVVRFAFSNRPSIMRTIRVLRDVQAARLGLLVNAMDVHSPEYFHYSGSLGYHGYYNGDSGKCLVGSRPTEPSS